MKRRDTLFLAETVAIAALCGVLMLAAEAFKSALARTVGEACATVPYEVGARPRCVIVNAKEAP